MARVGAIDAEPPTNRSNRHHTINTGSQDVIVVCGAASLSTDESTVQCLILLYDRISMLYDAVHVDDGSRLMSLMERPVFESSNKKTTTRGSIDGI